MLGLPFTQIKIVYMLHGYPRVVVSTAPTRQVRGSEQDSAMLDWMEQTDKAKLVLAMPAQH